MNSCWLFLRSVPITVTALLSWRMVREVLLPFICPSPTKSVAKQKSLASPGDIFDEGNIATDEEFLQYKVSDL